MRLVTKNNPQGFTRSLFCLPVLAVWLLLTLVSGVGAQEVLRVAREDEPLALRPDHPLSLADQDFLRNVTEGLTRIDSEGNVQPGIAERWQVNEEGTVYTFYLRESTWSDGTTLTAKDVVNSWKRLGEEARMPLQDFYGIRRYEKFHQRDGKFEDTGIRLVDDRTLEVTLGKPDPYFIHKLAQPYFAPFKEVEEEGQQEVIFNGPYQFQESEDEELLLVKNDHYWRKDQVALSRIHYKRVTEDERPPISQLDYIAPELLHYFREDLPEKEIQSQPLAATCWLKVNVTHDLTSNLDLRKALSLAVDRQTLVREFEGLHLKPTTQLVPSLVTGFEEEQSYIDDGNVAAAKNFYKKSLEELGGDSDPLALTLILREDAVEERLAEWLKASWEEHLEVSIQLQVLSDKKYLETLENGDYHLALAGWLASRDDPLEFLEMYATDDSGNNDTGWYNQSYYQLIDELKRSKDVKERVTLARNAEALLMQERPIIPLFNYSVNYWARHGFEHLEPNAFYHLDLSQVSH